MEPQTVDTHLYDFCKVTEVPVCGTFPNSPLDQTLSDSVKSCIKESAATKHFLESSNIKKRNVKKSKPHKKNSNSFRLKDALIHVNAAPINFSLPTVSSYSEDECEEVNESLLLKPFENTSQTLSKSSPSSPVPASPESLESQPREQPAQLHSCLSEEELRREILLELDQEVGESVDTSPQTCSKDPAKNYLNEFQEIKTQLNKEDSKSSALNDPLLPIVLMLKYHEGETLRKFKIRGDQPIQVALFKFIEIENLIPTQHFVLSVCGRKIDPAWNAYLNNLKQFDIIGNILRIFSFAGRIFNYDFRCFPQNSGETSLEHFINR
eukprot:Sdes_comp15462_c0_seq1m4363